MPLHLHPPPPHTHTLHEFTTENDTLSLTTNTHTLTTPTMASNLAGASPRPVTMPPIEGLLEVTKGYLCCVTE
jgi:hypothetical protein